MTEDLAEGLKKLRMGALLYIASIVVLLVGIVAALLAVFGGALMTPMRPENIALMIGAAGAGISVIIISLIIGIVAFVMWFIATGHLKRHNSALGIGRTGMILQIIAFILVVTIILAIIPAVITKNPMAIAATAGGVVLILIISFLLALVGAILFGIMLMRLAEEPNVESGFKITGILYIVAIILSLIPYVGAIGLILSLVSVILIFVYAGSSLEALRVGAPKFTA